MSSRETENNAYAKFWADKERALWHVMVFSGVVNRPFARWRHFTTTSRILFVFPFIFKFCNPGEV